MIRSSNCSIPEEEFDRIFKTKKVEDENNSLRPDHAEQDDDLAGYDPKYR
jgi:hypothetical protein